MTAPRLTFPFFELTSGLLGLQPRSVGGPVWVDNVRVTSIDRLSYAVLPNPAIAYSRPSLLTDWQVIGPLDRTNDAVAQRPGDSSRAWRAFETDSRGAVITARVVDHHGPRTVAYFRTRVTSAVPTPATLNLSTVDDLALWVNGRFHWFIPRMDAAWYDVGTNAKHEGRRIPISLAAGANEIVLRVRGGVYASGGFFARVERP